MRRASAGVRHPRQSRALPVQGLWRGDVAGGAAVKKCYSVVVVIESAIEWASQEEAYIAICAAVRYHLKKGKAEVVAVVPMALKPKPAAPGKLRVIKVIALMYLRWCRWEARHPTAAAVPRLLFAACEWSAATVIAVVWTVCRVMMGLARNQRAGAKK